MPPKLFPTLYNPPYQIPYSWLLDGNLPANKHIAITLPYPHNRFVFTNCESVHNTLFLPVIVACELVTFVLFLLRDINIRTFDLDTVNSTN